jgi:hypothetical protein
MQNEFYVYQRKVQISKQRKEIYLVGTHHLSKQSADDVRQVTKTSIKYEILRSHFQNSHRIRYLISNFIRLFKK